MKCSKCRATNSILAKVCESCGYSPLEADPAEQAAISLAARIIDNLSLLRAQAPSGRISSFVCGFLVLPTLGLVWIATKGWHAFSRPGKSAAKLEQELGADMRAADTAYGSDPSFRALLVQAKSEIEAHASCMRFALRHLLIGLVAFMLVACVVAGLVGIQASRRSTEIRENKKIEANAEDKKADIVLAYLHAGKIENAVAQLRLVSPSALTRIRSSQPEIEIVELAAHSQFEEAVSRAAQIVDSDARKTARSALAELALTALATDYDNTKAQTIAAFIEPQAQRLAALDNLLADQANRSILQNRYQDARSYIGAIASSELRAKLNALIAERRGR